MSHEPAERLALLQQERLDELTEARADAPESTPVSVRLGEVVPPEDPEDWTRPLTWVVAAGMLAAPAVMGAWLVLGRPSASNQLVAVSVIAAAIAGGGALTGVTQRGRWRAAGATIGSALFSALATAGLAASARQPGADDPVVALAGLAVVSGLGGAVASSPLVAWLARDGARIRVGIVAIGGAVAVAVVVARLLAVR